MDSILTLLLASAALVVSFLVGRKRERGSRAQLQVLLDLARRDLADVEKAHAGASAHADAVTREAVAAQDWARGRIAELERDLAERERSGELTAAAEARAHDAEARMRLEETQPARTARTKAR